MSALRDARAASLRRGAAWLALAAAVGCVTTSGRRIDTGQVQRIQLCATTEEDLLAWFGAPDTREVFSGATTVEWRFARAGPGAHEQQQLVVILNASKRVTNYELNPSPDAPVDLADGCAADPPKPAE